MASVGVDIVHIQKIEKLLRSVEAARKVFHPSELSDKRLEHIAGIFAAKEAYFKAAGKAPEWLSVEVTAGENSAPDISVAGSRVKPSVSISHDGEYAVAVVVIW